MDLEQIRREYLLDGLRREHLNENPRLQFEMWLQQAVDSGLHDPTAMVVATVDEYGCPNQRIVLLKQLDDRGFVFFTNYGSAKARELDANPAVSIHFPWHSMERQVRVRGVAKKIPVAESIKYFNSRPHDSQLAAWASKQSSKINSRTFLLNQFASMKEKFSKGQVPLPDFWGGYRIAPNYYEFWQGGQSRLHDRFEYRLLDDQKWEINRLAP